MATYPKPQQNIAAAALNIDIRRVWKAPWTLQINLSFWIRKIHMCKYSDLKGPNENIIVQVAGL